MVNPPFSAAARDQAEAYVDMSLEAAESIVGQALAHRSSAGKGPAKPSSMDDVLTILKRDQIDLFGAGVKYAKSQSGVDARALEGQLELAWGEACRVTADMLWRHIERARRSVRDLEMKQASGPLSDAQKKSLAEHSDAAEKNTKVANALMRLAREHLSRGAKVARKIIKDAPRNYLGYRVGADYFRLREDWRAFGLMMSSIEVANRKSVGLIFLKGVAAAERDKDLASASGYFRQALEKDPEFTRAQVQLVLRAQTPAERKVELEKLRKLNPSHQLLTWGTD